MSLSDAPVSSRLSDPLSIGTQVEEAWRLRPGMKQDQTSWLTSLALMKADQDIHLNGPTSCQKYFLLIYNILAPEAEASLSPQKVETTCFISTVMTDVSSISATPVSQSIRSVSTFRMQQNGITIDIYAYQAFFNFHFR